MHTGDCCSNCFLVLNSMFMRQFILYKNKLYINKLLLVNQVPCNRTTMHLELQKNSQWSWCISFHHRFFLWQGSCCNQYTSSTRNFVSICSTVSRLVTCFFSHDSSSISEHNISYMKTKKHYNINGAFAIVGTTITVAM